MKKIFTLVALGSFAFFSQMNAQCGLNISSTASTVCSGNNVTLTANATPPVNAMSLNSTMAAGNNHRGNMFDISATNQVTITSFDAHPMGNTTIAIYYKAGTWNGFANSPASWTLIGSAAVTAQPTGTPTPVPVPVNITIPAGQTYAFYVTSTNTAVSLNYTDGSAVGNIFASDANISFKEGAGLEYPFTNGTGSTFTPRVWNGVIHYTVPQVVTYSYLWNTTATTSSINPSVAASTQYTVQVNVTGCPTMYDTFNVQVSTPPVSAGADFAVCSGSPATLSGSGAVSYSWDNSVTDGVPFTPAMTMNYIVTGTDSIGCTATDTVNVAVNNLPAVNAGPDFSVCSGSSATLSGSGAVSYTWDNSVTDGVPFTPASAMNYVVTGTDANGCMNTDTIMVGINALPNVNAGNDTAICSGMPVTLSGSGAVSYSWDNSVTDGVPISPSLSLDYIVTGTDINGCVNTDTIRVDVNGLPNVNAGNNITVCNGSPVTLSGSGAVTYTWDNSVMDGVPFVPASTLTYNVTGTDVNGCMNTDSVTVTVNTVNTATSFLNETITASASGAAYQWINCSNNNPVAGATSQSYTATVNGDYAVIVTENGCVDTSACQNINSVGIEAILSADAFGIYPNPSNGKITIETGNEIATGLSVVNCTGEVILDMIPAASKTEIDLSAYAAGIYFARIITADGIKTVKIIRN
jgi:hypothetical protein